MKTAALLSILFFVCGLAAVSLADVLQPDLTDTFFALEEIWATPADSVFDLWKRFSFESWKGKPARKEILEGIISDLLHAYSRNGFPFAEISPRVEEAGSGRARLQLSVITGPAVFVSHLQCAAFSTGEQKQLGRMLAFYPGYFDEREVEGLKKRAQQFPELVWEGEPKLAEAPDFSSARLELPLSRRAKNRVAGGFGYLPSGSDNGVFGELSVQLVTLGKIGREVDFNWNRPNVRTRTLALQYQDFFLVPAAFYAFGKLSQEEREEQFFRFSAQAGVSVPAFGGWKAGLGLGYERVTPRRGTATAASNSDAVRQYGVGIEVQKGRKELPEEGHWALVFRLYHKKVFHENEINRGTPKQLGLEAARSIRFSPSWSIFLQGQGKARFVPAFLFTRSDLFYLGGYGSVRGYPDESFLAIRYLLGRMEPRFHLGAKDYLFGFLDFAHLSVSQNSSGLTVSDPFKPGAGLGISAGKDKLILAFGWGEKARIKDGIVYLRLSGEL